MTTTDELREWAKCWPDSAVVAVLNEAADEIERLGEDLENAYRLIRERHDIIGYERKLADDLADVLRRFFPMSHDGTYEVERVLARYREARQ